MCRSAIEQKLAWGPVSEWRSQEFADLKKEIFDKTKVMISETTLKRIWGRVKHDNIPSTHTLDALAQFLGFENWRNYRTQYHPDPNEKVRLKMKKGWVVLLLILPLPVLTIFFLLGGFGSRAVRSVDPSIRFEPEYIADGLPNTVKFHIDRKSIASNRIRVQLFWDERRTVDFQSNQEVTSGIYYFPGYFRAKLIVEDQIVQEKDVFIRAESWMATYDQQPVPRYFYTEDLTKDGVMQLKSEVLSDILDPSSSINLTFHKVAPMGVDGDHFQLETRIKNTWYEGGAICQTFKLVLLGRKGAFVIPFSAPGCVADIGLMVNERYESGDRNDLNAFGVDLTEWASIGLVNNHRNLRIYLNNQMIKEIGYQSEIGELVGIRFRFLGAGAVDYLYIRDGEGNDLVKEDFEEVL